MTVDERLERMEQILDRLSDAVADLRETAADSRDKVADLRQTVDGLRSSLLDFRTETIQRFEGLDRRLEMVAITVSSLDSRVPASTKAVMDMQVRMEKGVRPAA